MYMYTKSYTATGQMSHLAVKGVFVFNENPDFD